MKKLLLILNPNAGKGKARTDSGLFDAVCAFSEAGYLVNARMTHARGHATELARTLAPEHDLVVCCGGDGTLNETVCGLMQCSRPIPPLGYLPAGTTNDFAASLHLPKDFAAAANIVLSGAPMPLDVGSFNGRHFVYVASFGAFTQTSYTVPQSLKKALGHTAYVVESLRQLPTIHKTAQLSITADGECLDGEYLFGSISNSTSIGGVMKLSPSEVGLNDGKYELLLVKNIRTPSEIQSLVTALLTKNYDQEALIYRHVSHIEIRTKGEIPWTLDGEYAPGEAHIMIDNQPRAISIMTAAHSETIIQEE